MVKLNDEGKTEDDIKIVKTAWDKEREEAEMRERELQRKIPMWCIEPEQRWGTLTMYSGDILHPRNPFPIAHCVSLDFAMSRGFAKELMREFPNLREDMPHDGRIGKALYARSNGTNGERLIFNLITKERFFHKPSYVDLRAAVADLRATALELRCPIVSMPKIGCGRDKLDWERVRGILMSEFEGSGIKILIFKL